MEEARIEQRNLLFDSCRIPGFDLESKIDLLGIPTQIIPKMKAGTFLQIQVIPKMKLVLSESQKVTCVHGTNGAFSEFETAENGNSVWSR